MSGFARGRLRGRRQPEAFGSQDDGPRRFEQLGQQVREAHAALFGGARHAGEDLVRLRAGLRAVARRHLAHDHGRPDLALGEAVGGRYRGVVQEGEHLALVRLEMLAKSLVLRVALPGLEELGKLLLGVTHGSLPEALAPHLSASSRARPSWMACFKSSFTCCGNRAVSPR